METIAVRPEGNDVGKEADPVDSMFMAEEGYAQQASSGAGTGSVEPCGATDRTCPDGGCAAAAADVARASNSPRPVVRTAVEPLVAEPAAIYSEVASAVESGTGAPAIADCNIREDYPAAPAPTAMTATAAPPAALTAATVTIATDNAATVLAAPARATTDDDVRSAHAASSPSADDAPPAAAGSAVRAAALPAAASSGATCCSATSSTAASSAAASPPRRAPGPALPAPPTEGTRVSVKYDVWFQVARAAGELAPLGWLLGLALDARCRHARVAYPFALRESCTHQVRRWLPATAPSIASASASIARKR